MRRANESIPPRPGSVLDTSTAPLPETRSFDGISEFPNPITSAAEGGDDRWALGAENSSIGNVFEHGAYGMEIQDPTVEEEDSATMPELSVDINGQVGHPLDRANLNQGLLLWSNFQRPRSSISITTPSRHYCQPVRHPQFADPSRPRITHMGKVWSHQCSASE